MDRDAYLHTKPCAYLKSHNLPTIRLLTERKAKLIMGADTANPTPTPLPYLSPFIHLTRVVVVVVVLDCDKIWKVNRQNLFDHLQFYDRLV